MIRQGEIYLVDFGNRYNSEFGKTRPALILQSDKVNRLLDKMEYKSVAVVPLTTDQIEGAFFRVPLEPEGKLEKPSDIVCNWVCTVDLERIRVAEGVLTMISPAVVQAVREKVTFLLD